ncbi:MAG: flagellar biosynthetic protein FliO [Candidatus Zixiibacteriota bacterium]
MAKSSRQSRRPIVAAAVILLAAMLGLVVIRVGPVTAQQDASLSQDKSPGTDCAAEQTDLPRYTSMLPSLARLVLALVVVIVCIYAGIYLLKRLSLRRYAGRQGQLLEVIETAGVGPKKTVSLIKVADKSVLVGMTDTHISLLTEIDEAKTALMLSRQCHVAGDDRFASVLKSFTDKVKGISLGRNPTALET